MVTRLETVSCCHPRFASANRPLKGLSGCLKFDGLNGYTVKLRDIISSVQEYHPAADVDVIRKAYNFVVHSHQGQTRASGEPYVTHVEEVAYLTTKLKLDVPSIVAALLHDSVEDTDATIEDIRVEFGTEVASLVDGVTKLSRIHFSSREEQQAENFRKMLLAMAADIRILLIKLCDRIHNMRTLEYLSESRRMRIAEETRDIFAPLAHRLGIHWIKSELEDLSLRYLHPDIYENLKRYVNTKKAEREKYITKVVNLIGKELKGQGVSAEVTGRPKHFYSIYQKMKAQSLHFNEIYDLIAFRVMVTNVMACYNTLGVIHSNWKPIPGRFKDYIAMPKQNGYQSLHTTVIGPLGTRIEIQIRTTEMHDVAERGIAAHWKYKEISRGHKVNWNKSGDFTWLKDLAESGKTYGDPLEFMSNVKDDLFPHEVFVFSPKGDVVALAGNSTALDFAYNVHTEVGHHCVRARVNGQQVPIAYRLQNGDTVEIVTSKTQTPSKDWISIVATAKAKQRIRSWLRGEERNRSILVGKELLNKDLKKFKRTLASCHKDKSLAKAAQELGLLDEELLFAEVGYGKLSTAQVIAKLVPEETDIDQKLMEDQSALQKIFHSAAKTSNQSSGIKVSGLDNVVFRFARCCEPLPGDELVGYVSRGRGVAIHRSGCQQTLGFDPRRLIPVNWDSEAKPERYVKMRIRCMDEVGMLAKITQTISSKGASITAAQSLSTKDGKAFNTFEIQIQDARQLRDISRALQNIDGVLNVERHRQDDH